MPLSIPASSLAILGGQKEKKKKDKIINNLIQRKGGK